MEPAQNIIKALGGPSAVAEVIGIHRTRVSSWQRPRAAGGTGGRIPQDHIPALLALAREKGINLTADDFLGTVPDTPSVAPQPDDEAHPERAKAS